MNAAEFDRLRRSVGLRKLELAALLGVAPQTVSRWGRPPERKGLPIPRDALAFLLLYQEAPRSVRERVMMALASVNALAPGSSAE